jgi:hypothetical protein
MYKRGGGGARFVEELLPLRFKLLGSTNTARAEVAQGTPAQSHPSPSILGYDDIRFVEELLPLLLRAWGQV